MATYEQILDQLQTLLNLIVDLRHEAESIQNPTGDDNVDRILIALDQISSDLENAETIFDEADIEDDLPTYPTPALYEQMRDWAHMVEDSVREGTEEIKSDLEDLVDELEEDNDPNMAAIQNTLSSLRRFRREFWSFYDIMIGAA